VGKGTGLGLSISYGIVANQGGKIYARNLDGKGVVLLLSYRSTLTKGRETEMENDSKKKRILAIDDEPIIIRISEKVLTGEGFEVDVACNGLVGQRNDRQDGI